jgi:hypothetical protein
MRTACRTVCIALLTALTVGLGAGTAFGNAKGNVTAQRGSSGQFGGPFSLTFSAGGTEKKANGTFTYREPQGYTVSGKVTCYHQEGTRAVFTGPVTKERNPDNNTASFVVWVTDNDPALNGRDAFDVAGGALLGPDCGTNFPLDRFDDVFVQESLYYVTSGNIVVH